MATVPEGSPADIDAAVAAARRGVRLRAVAADVAGGADRRRPGVLEPLRRQARRDGRPHHARDGLAHVLLQPGPVAGAVDADRGVPRDRPRLPVGGVPRRRARRAGRRTPRAGRRGRRDPAVERPAVHDHVQARPGAPRGLHRRGEAGARDAARHLPDGRAPRRRPASRPASSTSWPAAARWASTWSRTRASTRSPSPARPRPAARSPRSAASSSSGSRLELGGKSAAIVLDDADLAATMEGLKFTALMNSGQACVAQTRILAVARQLRQRRRRARRRPSAPCRSATRWTRPPRSARWSPSASRSGSRSTSRSARRRAPASSLGGNGMPDGLSSGLVRPADDLRRRRQRHADRPGGDLRPGALGDPLRRRGRRRPDRQRLRLRPGRHRLDRRRGGRPRRRPPGPRRHLRREHLHDGLRRAVRRLQDLRHRPRVRPRGPGAVHRAEVDLQACGA